MPLGPKELAVYRFLFVWIANDLRLLHRNTIWRHFGLTDERCAVLDDETGSLEITVKDRTGLELAALFDRDIAMHLTVHRHALGLDLTADLGVFTDREITGRSDLALDFTVDCDVVLAA